MATAVAFSLRYRKPFSAGLAMTAELLEAGKARIGVDVRFSETSGAEGNDVSRVQGELIRRKFASLLKAWWNGVG